MIPARLQEILVPRRALLPVPPLLVHQHNRRQQAQPLHRKGNVGQIRYRAVPVLEIKGVQELLRPLRADLRQGLPHGQRRPRILGHGVGQHLGIGAMNGKNVGLVVRAGVRRGLRGAG